MFFQMVLYQNVLFGSTWLMDTAKCVALPITFVYCFGLQNLRRHMCCRVIKTNGIGAIRILVV